MSNRIKRKAISCTFQVQGQLSKIFLVPQQQYQPGRWLWNVGFAVGFSRRQLNDWYWKRRNKRARSLEKHMIGTSGIKAIARGFDKLLSLRWHIPPGDLLMLDCTSGDPERQFHAWTRWQKYHPDCCIDYEQKKFFWYRPPYPSDNIWDYFKIIPVTPSDPKANCVGERYFDCFRVQPKDDYIQQSNEGTFALSAQALSGLLGL